MHPDYSDITSRLGKPLWYYHQSVAMPRYEPFHPDLLGVYDHVAALTVIRCQCCRMEFFASVSFSDIDRIERRQGQATFPEIKLPTAEDPGWFDCWGDPPRHGSMEGACAAGDTMTSDFVRIAEFWIKDQDQKSKTWFQWIRKPEFEFDYSSALEG